MKTLKTILTFIVLAPFISFAQDKEAELTVKLDGKDSIKKVIVTVTDQGAPAKEVELKLFAERLGGELNIGEATTDDAGEAIFEFPGDLPGDKNGKVNLTVKLEENDVFMDNDAKISVDWGVKIIEPADQLERSLFAGRSRAPIYFIIIANAIIIGIWGTLVYIVFQMFRLRKLGTVSDDNHL